MPINKKYIESFEGSQYYHMYCKAVGNNLLFKSDGNRLHFLTKYAEYSNGYLDTYAYCLLDNHVHWLVKCVEEDKLDTYLFEIGHENLKNASKKIFEEGIKL